MTTLLAIHSFPGANACVERHFPYYLDADADKIIGISTLGGGCEWPEGIESVEIGENKYLDGEHLPRRLVDTFELMLAVSDFDVLCVCEYDVVFFNRIPFEKMKYGAAAHMAGRRPWGSAVDKFYHNPWILKRDTAMKFVVEGRAIIQEGICGYNTPESSPDVFFGLVMQRLHQPVQEDLFKEFSRNSLDCEGDLERARLAYRSGFDCIHGVKHAAELACILAEYISLPSKIGITQEEDATP